MTPLESAARKLVNAMEGVPLAGTDEQSDAILAAWRALWHHLHHMELQRERRAKRKVKS